MPSIVVSDTCLWIEKMIVHCKRQILHILVIESRTMIAHIAVLHIGIER